MTTFRLSNLADEIQEGSHPFEFVLTLYDITRVNGEEVQTVLDLTGLTIEIVLRGKSGTIRLDTELVGLASAGTVKAVTTGAGDLLKGPLTIQAEVTRTSDGGMWPSASVETCVVKASKP